MVCGPMVKTFYNCWDLCFRNQDSGVPRLSFQEHFIYWISCDIVEREMLRIGWICLLTKILYWSLKDVVVINSIVHRFFCITLIGLEHDFVAISSLWHSKMILTKSFLDENTHKYQTVENRLFYYFNRWRVWFYCKCYILNILKW